MKKLYKSRKNKVIDGVCGGLAEYLEIDATVVRLLWALTTFIWGAGILLYILAMIIIPREPIEEEEEKEDVFEEKDQKAREKTLYNENIGKVLIALVVIIIGLFLLLPGSFSVFFWKLVLGIMLIAGGGFIIFKSLRKEQD